MEVINNSNNNSNNNNNINGNPKRKLGSIDNGYTSSFLQLPDNCNIHKVIMDGKEGLAQLKDVEPDDYQPILSVMDIGSKLIATPKQNVGIRLVKNSQVINDTTIIEYLVHMTFPFDVKFDSSHLTLIQAINPVRIATTPIRWGVDIKLNQSYLLVTIASVKNPIITKDLTMIYRTMQTATLYNVTDSNIDEEEHGESIKRRKTVNKKPNDK